MFHEVMMAFQRQPQYCQQRHHGKKLTIWARHRMTRAKHLPARKWWQSWTQVAQQWNTQCYNANNCLQQCGALENERPSMNKTDNVRKQCMKRLYYA